jgi:hypothetical protein
MIGKSLALLALLITASPSPAQPKAPDGATRAHSFDVLIRRIDHYVDPGRKAAIVTRLRRDRETLLALQDNDAFMAALNKSLYEASNDKHLMVFLKGPNPPRADDASLGTYGIGKIERLAGGVAYLEVSGFSNAPESRGAVDRAMASVADAPALVLDLRNNGGGGEVSFGRLLGHLFAERKELGSIEWRQCAPPPPDRPDACDQVAPRLERRFTDPPPRPAFASKPVYVLVSRGTFSAAEALAHELQGYRRATIVGERTGGGGNPSAGMDLESEFVVIMPIGRGKPINGTGWEGVGVRPDVETPADEALQRVLQMHAGGA